MHIVDNIRQTPPKTSGSDEANRRRIAGMTQSQGQDAPEEGFICARKEIFSDSTLYPARRVATDANRVVVRSGVV